MMTPRCKLAFPGPQLASVRMLPNKPKPRWGMMPITPPWGRFPHSHQARPRGCDARVRTLAAEHLRDCPWFAIGGITLENVDEVLPPVPAEFAVLPILNAPDVAHACQQFQERSVSVPLD